MISEDKKRGRSCGPGFGLFFLSQGPGGLRREKSSEAPARRKRGRFRLKTAKKPMKTARRRKNRRLGCRLRAELWIMRAKGGCPLKNLIKTGGDPAGLRRAGLSFNPVPAAFQQAFTQTFKRLRPAAFSACGNLSKTLANVKQDQYIPV